MMEREAKAQCIRVLALVVTAVFVALGVLLVLGPVVWWVVNAFPHWFWDVDVNQLRDFVPVPDWLTAAVIGVSCLSGGIAAFLVRHQVWRLNGMLAVNATKTTGE